MANHKSASKRNRQRLVRTARARSFRAKVRGAIKVANVAIEGKTDDAAALVLAATRLLDQAASKNALPTKRASRLVGRPAAKLHKSTAS